MLSALLLGAGAGIVGAFPHPQQRDQQWGHGGHKHHFSGPPKYTAPWPSMPTAFPTMPSGSAASGIIPTGYGGTTGTGTGSSSAAQSCAVQYVTVDAPSTSSAAVESSPSSVESVSSYASGAASSSVASPVSILSATSIPAYSAAASSSAAITSSAAAPSSVYAAADSSSAASASPIASAGASAITADDGCTFTSADAAMDGKGDCSKIVLDGITVPAGETLDLSDLNDGTTVCFSR